MPSAMECDRSHEERERRPRSRGATARARATSATGGVASTTTATTASSTPDASAYRPPHCGSACVPEYWVAQTTGSGEQRDHGHDRRPRCSATRARARPPRAATRRGGRARNPSPSRTGRGTRSAATTNAPDAEQALVAAPVGAHEQHRAPIERDDDQRRRHGRSDARSRSARQRGDTLRRCGHRASAAARTRGAGGSARPAATLPITRRSRAGGWRASTAATAPTAAPGTDATWPAASAAP